MILPEAIRRFLEHCEVERGRSAATLRTYTFVLERFAAFAAREQVTTTDGVTLELIRRFRLWLHRRPGRRSDTLARGTQQLHLVVLRAFLKYLATRDIPALAAEKIELVKLPDREVAFLEPEEMEQLLAAPQMGTAASALPIVRLRDAAIIEVLFSTGMRVGELVGLQKKDVPRDRDEVAVRGKGGKIRVVFLSPDARGRLRRYLAARRDVSPFLFVRHDRASLKVWGTGLKDRDDQPLTARSIERLVQRSARAAGIAKPVHPHTLRHSFATDLLRNGAQLRDVQVMLGHASVTTTQVYTHVTAKHLRDTHARYHRHRT